MWCLAKLDNTFQDPWDLVSIMMNRNKLPSVDIQTKGKHTPLNSKFTPEGISGLQNNHCFQVNVIPGVLFNSEEREQQTSVGDVLREHPWATIKGEARAGDIKEGCVYLSLGKAN